MPQDYRKITLPNGLRLLLAPMSNTKAVTVVILAGTGSRYESENQNGISHFLEHMLFKGTKDRPNKLALSTTIDGIGGQFNAFTSEEYTGYYIKALATHFDLAIDVLTDMVLNSLFPPREIQKELGVILQEIAMYEDVPQYKVEREFEKLIFSPSSLGWDILGTPQTVSSLVQKDFFNYIDTHYYPENLLVTIAGNFSPSQAKSQITKHMGKLPSRHKSPQKPRISFTQNSPRIATVKRPTEQTHLIAGWLGFPLGHPSRFAEAVLSALLADTMSSRLFQAIRENRGWAYYIKSAISHHLDTGFHAVRAGVKVEKAPEAIKVIIDQCEKLTQKSPTAKELTIAKEYVKGNLVLDLEDSMSTALFFGKQELLENKIKTAQELIAKVDKVTAADVVKTAKALFQPQKFNLAVVGPHTKASFGKMIKSG